MLPRYQRRRFREEEDEEVGWHAASAAATTTPGTVVAAALTSPRVRGQRWRRDGSGLSPSATLSVAVDADALSASPPTPMLTPSRRQMQLLQPPSAPPSAAASSTAAVAAAAPAKSRLSLDFERTRKVLVEVFVQKWSVQDVTEKYQQIFDLLYPASQPSTDSADVLDALLGELLDDLNGVLAGSVRSVALDDIRIDGESGGKYQTSSVHHRRPLVIANEQLREIIDKPFDMPEAALMLNGPTAAAAAEEEERTTAESESMASGAEEEQLERARASKEQVRLQAAVRPFLEQVLSLHSVTMAGTPLRNRSELLGRIVAAHSHILPSHAVTHHIACVPVCDAAYARL